MSVVVAAALGAGVGLGVFLIILGLAGVPIATPTRPTRRLLKLDRMTLRVGLATAGLIVGIAMTGWAAFGLLCASAGAGLPSLVGAQGRRRQVLERSEAIASWSEMLRDTMAAAAGIQEAITATARVAPAPIRPQVQDLAARIQREPLRDALRAFAAEVADPTADMVVAALIIASDKQARSLGELLGTAAASARASATMRLKVEAGRARTYTSTRMILGVTGAFGLGLIVFNRDYLAPFGTPIGQLVLLAIGCLFAAALWAMARMGRVAEPERFLHAFAEADR